MKELKVEVAIAYNKNKEVIGAYQCKLVDKSQFDILVGRALRYNERQENEINSLRNRVKALEEQLKYLSSELKREIKELKGEDTYEEDY